MSDTADSSTLADGDSYRQSTSPAAFAPQAQSAQDNLIKVTRGHSCILCQQRKVRCDKNKPCSNCVRAGVECRVIPPQPPRRRKKRVAERDLVERLRKYEALLTLHGIEFEALGPDIKITDPGTAQEGDELDTDFVRVKDPAGQADPDLISSPGETPHMPRTFKWFPFQKEFRATDEMIRDSSDEDDVGSSINHAYDKMFDNSDGFPFLVGGAAQSVTDQHPSAIQIIQLWQAYLNNVNPLLKLTHTPTLQERIIEASANIEKVSKSLEALMFAIYFMAITSLQDDEVLATFNEPKAMLLQRYYTACQQALINAGFMRNPDLTILQAFLLYLIGIRHYMDPRTLFCLTGIAVRLAYRMGLHRDGAQFNLSPFEIEERRRLWWNLAGFDRRIGEMTGSTITAISNGGDCKLPLNINDADLHLHAKDPPISHTSATEMVFSLTRLEFAKAPGSDKMKSVLSDVNPQPVNNVADHRMSNYLERFTTHLEDTYLKHCDPKIPLHYFTLTMTRANTAKLKLLSAFFKVALTTPTSLTPAENDATVIEAIKMIEYDSMIYANESLKGFLWYTLMHFPFPAYVCLIKDLRTRTTGELCERAWQAIFEHHERRKLIQNMGTPMHIGFSTLFVKAWDAREAAEAQQGRTLAPPPTIIAMRQLVARLKTQEKSKSPEPQQAPVVPRSFASPEADVTQQSSPNVNAYPTNMWAGVPGLDVNRQYQGAFVDVNFGGEVDWQFLMQQYGGFNPQQPMGTIPTHPQPSAYWQ
ncbi:fungal-specific transcription factor domain-containing protein [Xylariales sp. PMI_506]|nr:fungal-specific transcription factor domain-containing protein [Xylariales sp. PMI_506]